MTGTEKANSTVVMNLALGSQTDSPEAMAWVRITAVWKAALVDVSFDMLRSFSTRQGGNFLRPRQIPTTPLFESRSGIQAQPRIASVRLPRRKEMS